MRSSFNRSLRRAAGLGLLSLLGAAAASSVQAQSLTLNSGDSATVSSAGTSGILGGKPFSNSTSSYSNPFGGAAVQVNGTAAFTLAGGTIITSHGTTGLSASGTGPVIISGGTFSSDSLSAPLAISSGAVVQITGGAFSDSGPTPDNGVIGLGSGGSLYLFSKNDTPFTITGIPGISTFNGVSYNNTSLSLASLSSSPGTTYGVSGTLADGESFNTHLNGLGTINFNLPVPAAVPEASTTVSLGLLLMLGFGGMVMARRKKTAA